MKTVIIKIMILVVMCGCATTDVTKRYTKAEFNELLTGAEVGHYLDVLVESYPVTTKEPQHKTVFDLADHGQQAFIAALAGKAASTQDFMSKLIEPLESKQTKNVIDSTKITRTLVFSIRNNIIAPGNRIDSIELSVALNKSDKVRFSAWDKVVTTYQFIDIGKVTLGQKSSFSLSPEIKTDIGLSGKIATGSYEKSLQEEIGIRDRLVTSGRITNQKITLFLKGASGIDLSGNIIAQVELEAIDKAEKVLCKFNNLFQNDGSPESNLKKIDIKEQLVIYPNFHEEIKGSLQYDFVFREVKTGGDTFFEGDDVVVFHRGKGGVNEKLLVEGKEYAIDVWVIKNYENRKALHKTFEGKDARKLYFSSEDGADNFLRWLKNVLFNVLQEYKVGWGNGELIRESELSTLKVEHESFPPRPLKVHEKVN